MMRVPIIFFLIATFFASCLPHQADSSVYTKLVAAVSEVSATKVVPVPLETSARKHMVQQHSKYIKVPSIGPTVALVTEENGVYCSGTLIAKDLVLTASHCIDDSLILVRFDNSPDKIVAAEVAKIGTPEAADLALLHLDYPVDMPVAPVAAKDPPVFAPIVVTGCPAGNCQVATSGVVGGYQGVGRGRRLTMENKIWFGNSGGAAMDKTGHIVGVTSTVNCNTPGLFSPIIACYGHWITAQAINKFLDEAPKD